ncbi:MAG: hypothetical protein RLY93_14235 [Sumerlaeia bacterium]
MSNSFSEHLAIRIIFRSVLGFFIFLVLGMVFIAEHSSIGWWSVLVGIGAVFFLIAGARALFDPQTMRYDAALGFVPNVLADAPIRLFSVAFVLGGGGGLGYLIYDFHMETSKVEKFAMACRPYCQRDLLVRYHWDEGVQVTKPQETIRDYLYAHSSGLFIEPNEIDRHRIEEQAYEVVYRARQLILKEDEATAKARMEGLDPNMVAMMAQTSTASDEPLRAQGLEEVKATALAEADALLETASERWRAGDIAGALEAAKAAGRIRREHLGDGHPKVEEVKRMVLAAQQRLASQ